jgi:hypothetical protein
MTQEKNYPLNLFSLVLHLGLTHGHSRVVHGNTDSVTAWKDTRVMELMTDPCLQSFHLP